MADPISNLGHLVEVLRRQLTSRSETGRTTTRATTSKSKEKTNANNIHRDIQADIHNKVAAIDPDDPHRRKKAIRIFIESVLYQEFGDKVINDPRLYSLANDVQQTMESDPTTLNKLNQLVDEMMRR